MPQQIMRNDHWFGREVRTLDRLRGMVAFVALLGAIGLPTVGWLFFRQPGVSVWDAQVPIWRAGEYLTATGVALRLAGLPAMIVGATLVLIEARQACRCG